MKRNLKNKKVISELFDKGKYLSSGDILIKYLDSEPGFLFTVSSKKFKRAVDRNRVKRILRESVKDTIPNKSIAIIYIGNDLPKFKETKESLSLIFNKIC